MSVSHEGGVFISRNLDRASADFKTLMAVNQEVMTALNMVRGVTHAEYIKAHADGQFYFLETAARVGGANIAEMVEAASGLNLWREWARLEVAHAKGEVYHPSEPKPNYAGVMQCLSRQEHPDLSPYNDPEVVYRATQKYHAGLVLASPDAARVQTLLDDYTRRFAHDFLAVLPALDKPHD
jgi:hypothetical protein